MSHSCRGVCAVGAGGSGGRGVQGGLSGMQACGQHEPAEIPEIEYAAVDAGIATMSSTAIHNVQHCNT
jgi:hypothetical protein